jgi:CelD/BcsL family acetyltransferase involved in cellulose biosynthesis
MRALMDFEAITTADTLNGIVRDWNELWQRDPNATPFQSPHWLMPWWRVFGTDELFVVAGRENGRLDALAPLTILRDEDSGESLGIFIGSGNTDYLDVLLAPEAVPSGLFEAMTRDGVCQMWDLQQLRPGSPILVADSPPGWMANDAEQEPCLVLSIENAGGELQNLLSTHARKKLRYYLRSLERDATIAFEQPTNETLDAFVDALFALHAARWKERDLPGMLADEPVQDFHRQVARAMFDAGALRMYALRRNGAIIAIFYGFAHHGTVHYYLSGYDPAFEKWSIGGVIVAHALEQAVREGAHTFDFLRGAEDYKSSWGAVARMNMRRQLIRSD